ncbi:class I adenylate-forming enzyme family protein [Ornithinimicrobium cavernae]|uniref:class I adenylate-forming enzyme family protein n=1 Tax=Ornithinimicrobium cavernae TaxID=2666047 RepID=UPI00137993BE|nr:class I adenylate-forming enzyme family protein [Ornithinimicrobium cavernae]
MTALDTADAHRQRISDYVVRHAEASPDRTALISHDWNLTYRELRDEVDRHARALLAAGVQRGDRVALMATPGPVFVISFLATASIGAVWQGLNPRYSSRELSFVIGDSAPRVVLSTMEGDAGSPLAEALADNGATPAVALRSREDLEAFNAAGAGADDSELRTRRQAVDPADPALIVYTSGTTGAPKGALLRHSGLVRLGHVEADAWAVEAPVMICNLPVNHIASVGDLVSVPLVAGGTLLLREGFDVDELLADIAEHRITTLFQIPTQLQRLASHPDFGSADLSSLQVVAWGGSPLPAESLRRYRDAGCRLVSTYGLTEATSSVTYSSPGASDEVLLHTVGAPDPGMNVRILDDAGEWTTTGSGEICVRHDTVMAGYLNRPDATAEAFTADGWLRTGDVGHLREDGNLVLVGRTKEMFKSGGYNIYPREIEAVIESHPDTQMCAVVPRPDPEYHEVGVAFVQRRPASPLDEQSLREWCRERLANFKIPKGFVFLDELPLLPVGKVDKNALRAVAADGLTDAGTRA